MKRLDSWTLPIRIGLLLLLASGLATGWMLLHEREARRWVSHTAEVREELADFRITALHGEVARRGYLITGNPADLEAYYTATHQISAKLGALRRLTADNPGQQQRLQGLNVLLTEHMARARAAAALRQTGGLPAAAALLNNPGDRQRTRNIVILAEAFLAEEVRLDHLRQKRAARIETITLALLGGSALMLLVVMLLAAQDRRQRVKALEALNRQLEIDNARRQAAEHELALLAQNATDAVFRLGLDGRFLYASPSVAEIIGAAPDDLVGKSLFAALHPDDEVAVFTALHRLRMGEIERITLSYRVRLPRDPEVWTWLEASSGIIRDEFGMALEIIASIRNIDLRKQMELDLREARRAAEEAAAAKSAFLANMSHEIRTPMNGVVGFTDLLLTTPLSPQQRRYVKLIAESGEAMTRLLNDILDFSKVEAGQMKIAHEVLDLPATLQACATLVTPAMIGKNLKLRVELAQRLPHFIRGDALRLRQILLNLLGNAAKFTHEGRVTLRAGVHHSDGGPQLVIEVEDTGIGISAERQAAIFDPFVQAEVGTAASFGGTGLGLPISVQLARLMGGALTLSSEPGRGTVIMLTLPLTEAEAPDLPAAPSADGALPAASEGLRVLVAEDHDVNQLLVAAMLRQLGCRIEIAADGATAVRMARAAAESDPYALVLMDLQMPVMGGLNATRQIRAGGLDAETLPIVAVTANAYADDIATCLAAGMQDHLAKPLKLAELATVIERWTGRAGAPAPVPAQPAIESGVRGRYRLRKDETLAKLEEAAALPALDSAVLDELSDLLHKLAGTAGMFGEAPLGDRARDLEQALAACPAPERQAALIAALPGLRAAA